MSLTGVKKVAEGSEQRIKSFGLLIAIDNQNLRTSRGRVQQGAVDRLGRQSQPGEAKQPRTGGRAHLAGQRLECRIARQSRKQLLDLRIPQTEGSVAFY